MSITANDANKQMKPAIRKGRLIALIARRDL
jgi:hypothetical protein